MISNSELSITVGDKVWEPDNSTDTFGPPVSMKTALQFSMNVPTVRLAQKIGMASVAKTAEAFHMYDDLPHLLSAALGSVETTPYEGDRRLRRDRGRRKEVVPTLIDSVQDRFGASSGAARPGLRGLLRPGEPPDDCRYAQQIADPYADRR